MADFKKLVGRRIKLRRKAMGYSTQDKFGHAVGVDRTRIAKWESGTNLPKGEFKATILRLLKVSESELFSVDAMPPANQKTVGDMTPAELKSMIESASSPETANAALLSAWEQANSHRRDLALYFLTGSARHLRKVVQVLQPEVELIQTHLDQIIRDQAASASRKGK